MRIFLEYCLKRKKENPKLKKNEDTNDKIRQVIQ